MASTGSTNTKADRPGPVRLQWRSHGQTYDETLYPRDDEDPEDFADRVTAWVDARIHDNKPTRQPDFPIDT